MLPGVWALASLASWEAARPTPPETGRATAHRGSRGMDLSVGRGSETKGRWNVKMLEQQQGTEQELTLFPALAEDGA